MVQFGIFYFIFENLDASVQPSKQQFSSNTVVRILTELPAFLPKFCRGVVGPLIGLAFNIRVHLLVLFYACPEPKKTDKVNRLELPEVKQPGN